MCLENPHPPFGQRATKKIVEEGSDLAPKFDANGLIPVITTDFQSGELLMQAYMNEEALLKTIETGQAVYWSRSRQELWHKGATSGHYQEVQEMRVDCDQDSIWLRVTQIGGAACHVGYKSCFYRTVPVGEIAQAPTEKPIQLEFAPEPKVYDPDKVYGK
ncbi:MAG: phosphoribosyl-AMP cyclohydrolase [Verrucomicrobiota bacterium]